MLVFLDRLNSMEVVMFISGLTKRRLNKGLSLLLMMVGLVLLQGRLVQSEIRVGQAFPELVLPSVDDGNPLSVQSFRGQKLVLHIWASW